MDDDELKRPATALEERFRLASLEGASSLFMTFDEIGALLGGLPQDAFVQKRWWTNSSAAHVKVWHKEGWTVDGVGFRLQKVAFKRR